MTRPETHAKSPHVGLSFGVCSIPRLICFDLIRPLEKALNPGKRTILTPKVRFSFHSAMRFLTQGLGKWGMIAPEHRNRSPFSLSLEANCA